MLAPTLRETDRDAERAATEEHRRNLRSEALEALLHDPARKVSAPGWERGEAPAYDILYDELAGHNSDAMRGRLCRILADAATQVVDAKLQEAALRFLIDVVDAHAEARAGLGL